MNEITVKVGWLPNNFSACFGMRDFGAVIVTAPTYDDVRREFAESLREQIDAMLDDGEDVPEWMVSGDYKLVFEPSAAAAAHISGK